MCCCVLAPTPVRRALVSVVVSFQCLEWFCRHALYFSEGRSHAPSPRASRRVRPPPRTSDHPRTRTGWHRARRGSRHPVFARRARGPIVNSVVITFRARTLTLNHERHTRNKTTNNIPPGTPFSTLRPPIVLATDVYRDLSAIPPLQASTGTGMSASAASSCAMRASSGTLAIGTHHEPFHHVVRDHLNASCGKGAGQAAAAAAGPRPVAILSGRVRSEPS